MEYCRSHQAHVEHFDRNDARLKGLEDDVDGMKECIIKLTHIQEADATWKKELSSRMNHLEAAPRKRWEHVINTVVVAVIGIIVGYLLKSIGLY